MANEETLQQVRDAQGNWSGIETGQETVAAAGTSEQLNGGTSLSVPDGSDVIIRALPGNTDTAYIGDDTVSATTGHAIGPSDPPLRLSVTDVATVYVDVAVSGEGVSWAVVNE